MSRRLREITVCAVVVLALPFLSGWAPLDSNKVQNANRLFADGKYAQAQEKYVSAQAKNPNSPELYYNIADVKYRMKEYPQAEEILKKVIQSPASPVQQKAFYNLGNTKVRQGQLEEALNFYK